MYLMPYCLKLQYVHKHAPVHPVCSKKSHRRRNNHMIPTLSTLHWLPGKFNIDYGIIFDCCHCFMPTSLPPPPVWTDDTRQVGSNLQSSTLQSW